MSEISGVPYPTKEFETYLDLIQHSETLVRSYNKKIDTTVMSDDSEVSPDPMPLMEKIREKTNNIIPFTSATDQEKPKRNYAL